VSFVGKNLYQTGTNNQCSSNSFLRTKWLARKQGRTANSDDGLKLEQDA
jgi:hypothetical protein